MQLGEWVFLFSMGFSSCAGAIFGLENGWKLNKGPQYALVGASAGVIIPGFFQLLLGGSLPWVKTWAYFVICLAGVFAGLGSYLVVARADGSKFQAYLAGPLAGLTTFMTIYLLGLRL